MYKALGLVVLVLACSHSAVAEVSGLLDKVASAYGGQKRITETRAFQQSGTTYSSLHEGEGNVLRSYRHPDHLRIEIAYDVDNPEIRILAGDKAWRGNKPATGPFYSSMLLQAARLGLPAILFDFIGQVSDAGTMTGTEGQELHALELNFHGRYKLVVGIDADTGRIIESRGILDMNGARMEFGTLYSDFRFQDGRLFAFEEVHYAMGQKTGFTRLQRIEILPDLPEDLFHPSVQRKPDTMASLPVREEP